MSPWEIHPALVHFPLAFLLGAVVAQAWALHRSQGSLHQVASTIAVWGVALGWVAAAAGVVAWLTLPAHSEAVHGLMLVHAGLALAGLIAFTASVLLERRVLAPIARRWLARAGAALIASAALAGGRMVYRGGAGIAPDHSEAAPEGHHHSHSH